MMTPMTVWVIPIALNSATPSQAFTVSSRKLPLKFRRTCAFAKLMAKASGNSPIDEYAARQEIVCSDSSNTLIPHRATAARMMCANQIITMRDKPYPYSHTSP